MKHLPNILLFLAMVACLATFVHILHNFDQPHPPDCPTGLTTVYDTFQDRDGTTGLVRMCVSVTNEPGVAP